VKESVRPYQAQQRGKIATQSYCQSEPWRAYQRWLALGERRVVVPFARALVIVRGIVVSLIGLREHHCSRLLRGICDSQRPATASRSQGEARLRSWW
jgi:hypothetical protein